MSDHPALLAIRAFNGVERSGRVQKIMPTWIEADGPNVPVGTICRIESASDHSEQRPLLAEVIRIDQASVALVPYSGVATLSIGARVVAESVDARAPVGLGFLGRAIDPLGAPIDGGKAIIPDQFSALNCDPPAPLERETPAEILETGIRVIDGLLTLGRGQRVGIFAASGVGKTSLLSQLLRQVDADVCVTCLVGERGREVEAIWSNELSGETRKRSVLIAATSDQAAALRVRAVYQAVALARYWRDMGLNVFLVLDSVTRFAMALRELGLAAGEPPTVRAYTPSVFSVVPRIVEQFGALKSGGSISAVMTILSETDDVDDPLSELMKSLLDGHLILSRTLAERGHFPAIDVLKSVSRNTHALITASHRDSSMMAHASIARFEGARTLIESGIYVEGSNDEIDAAIALRPALERFTAQKLDESPDLAESLALLETALRSDHART